MIFFTVSFSRFTPSRKNTKNTWKIVFLVCFQGIWGRGLEGIFEFLFEEFRGVRSFGSLYLAGHFSILKEKIRLTGFRMTGPAFSQSKRPGHDWGDVWCIAMGTEILTNLIQKWPNSVRVMAKSFRTVCKWGRSNLVDRAGWPKICLLNRDLGNILSIFPKKNSETQSSLNFL